MLPLDSDSCAIPGGLVQCELFVALSSPLATKKRLAFASFLDLPELVVDFDDPSWFRYVNLIS
jgi:hypothetical protein